MPIALALCASLFWGLADFMGGSLSRRHPLLAVLLVSQGVGMVGILVVAFVRTSDPSSAVVLPGIAAGLSGVAAALAFYRAMSIGSISVAAPILATGAVVPVVAGLATGERPGSLQMAGIVAALVGVVLASREPDPGGGSVRGAGVLFALLAALMFGLQLIALDHAARSDAIWGVTVARVTAVVVLASAAAVTRPRLSRGVGVMTPLVVIGVLDTTANTAFALAATEGLLSVVSVLGSLFPVVTVALAHIHLHERLARGQRLGVVLALAGTLAIAGG
jgi:drug/metabolite transporter (DMT)-like permease